MRRLKYLRTHEVELEKAGLGPVAGVDEAGRGSCAGPITIAACILPTAPIAGLAELNDSKKLTDATRARLFDTITRHAIAYSIVNISAREIDTHGIQYANTAGMRAAVAALSPQPEFVLYDALAGANFRQPALSVSKGDAHMRCIAAASILAKHSRDQLLIELGEIYPGYGLEKHKGYGTKIHMDAVRLHGATPEHRYSYANVAEAHAQFLASQGAQQST